jgi:hypothetical protein
MTVITFILVYVLIGIVVASIFAWNEIQEVFDRCERDSQNPLTKEEWQEFWLLITTYTLGWGVFTIYLFVIDPIRTLYKKCQ